MTVHLTIALVPVLLFLALLWFMDSFRLVRRGAILAAMGYGCAAALVAAALNGWLAASGLAPAGVISRYVAPVLEESLKAAFIIALIRTRRVGFHVDAALQGFAVGTGFALVENLWYLWTMPQASVLLWLVRGFGTAMLHGGNTAIFAIVSKALVDRRQDDESPLAYVPAGLAVIALHSAFNHQWLPVLAQTLLLLIILPLLVVLVFERSERLTREYVGAGLDLDVELLNLVRSDAFTYTRFGRYLQELRDRLPGPVVADMFCLLRLELELSVQAKGLLLARNAGLELAPDDDLDAVLDERRFLQQSIGLSGLLAIRPLNVTSRSDDYHRHLLSARAPAPRR